MGVIAMGRWFSISGDGAPLGVVVTLADRQHTGNDPQCINPRKIMLNFGAIIYTIISATNNIPNLKQQTQKGWSLEGQRITPRLRETTQLKIIGV